MVVINFYPIMMGDRDFRTVIKNSIESVGKELDYKIDIENFG